MRNLTFKCQGYNQAPIGSVIMNSETFYKRLNSCSSLEELESLRISLKEDISTISNKNTESDIEILKYITNNTERFCKNLFKGETENKLEDMKNSTYLQEATKSLCRFLGIEDKNSYKVLGSWNSFKLKGMKKRLTILEKRIKNIRELEEEEQKSFFEYKQRVIKETKELEW